MAGKRRKGRVIVIAGCMFAGKTEELQRLLKRAELARQKIQVFKPKADSRYGINHVVSHSGLKIEAQPVDRAEEILALVDSDTIVVGIDEGQFFDWEIAEVCQQLADAGKTVIVAGLNMDFRGEPFGPVPILMAQADELRLLTAICLVCGEEATRSQRLIDGCPAPYDDSTVVVGDSETYEARCRACHEVGKPSG